jgi:hypothetical protein
MRAVNPAFVPRNHRGEQAIDEATDEGDFSPFFELLNVLSRPYDDQVGFVGYANPPRPANAIGPTSRADESSGLNGKTRSIPSAWSSSTRPGLRPTWSR